MFGEGNGTPLQYSCLENPMDGGRWGSDRTERLHFLFSLSCIGEGNGNPLQCSCLENPRDGGAWWAAVYGVAQSRTRLKQLSSSSSSSRIRKTPSFSPSGLSHSSRVSLGMSLQETWLHLLLLWYSAAAETSTSLHLLWKPGKSDLLLPVAWVSTSSSPPWVLIKKKKFTCKIGKKSPTDCEITYLIFNAFSSWKSMPPRDWPAGRLVFLVQTPASELMIQWLRGTSGHQQGNHRREQGLSSAWTYCFSRLAGH